MTHPTPWAITVYEPSNATAIYDADGALVETVYGRGDDPHGRSLATRIVDAVNKEPS